MWHPDVGCRRSTAAISWRGIPDAVGISVYERAKAIKVLGTRANDIVIGRRAVTIDTALRLGRYFGASPEFWIDLQTRYNPDVADVVRRRMEQDSPRAA